MTKVKHELVYGLNVFLNITTDATEQVPTVFPIVLYEVKVVFLNRYRTVKSEV